MFERGQAWVLAAVVAGSLVVFLDATIINVALAAIGRDLPTTAVGVLEGQSYVASAYLLALSSVLILAGGLADRYGRRRMFLLGLTGFGVTSALCGAAPTMEVLIVARLAQGVSGAFLVPTSLAIISATFSGPPAGRAYGIWTAATSIAFVAGPAFGGLLVDTVSWRAVFFINLPVAGLAWYLGWRYVGESRDEHGRQTFDWIGALAVAIAVGGLAFGAIRGQQSNWTDPTAWWALAVGAITTVALVPLMLRRPNPLIPPHLFAVRNFSVVNVSTLLIYGTITIYYLIQAVFLQGTLGYTAMAAGLVAFPSGLLLALLSTPAGTWAGRLGPRRFMVVGPLLMAMGLVWLARLPMDSPAWPATAADPFPPAGWWVDLLPALLLWGVGLGLMVAPLTQALMNSVAVRHAAVGSAVNNTVARIGPLLTLAAAFVIVSAVFYASLATGIPGMNAADPAVREAFPPLAPPTVSVSEAEATAVRAASTDAFHAAMWLGAALLTAGAAVNGLGIRPGPRPES